MKPYLVEAMRNLSLLYNDQQEFEKAIGLESGDPEPYYELGKIYQAKSEQNKEFIERAFFYLEKYLYLGGEKETEVKELLEKLKRK